MGKGVVNVDSVLASVIFVLAVVSYIIFLQGQFKYRPAIERNVIEISRAVVEGRVVNGTDVGMGEYVNIIVFNLTSSGVQNFTLPTLYDYNSTFLYTFPSLGKVEFSITQNGNTSVVVANATAGLYILFYGFLPVTGKQAQLTPSINSTADVLFRGAARVMVFKELEIGDMAFGRPFRISIGQNSTGFEPPARGKIEAISFPQLCLQSGEIVECEVRVEAW